MSNLMGVVGIAEIQLVDSDINSDTESIETALDQRPKTLEELKELGVQVDDVEQTILNDAFLTTPELVRKYGYPIEVHKVTTKDGYILEVHRIPGSPAHPYNRQKQAVLLMHGFICSSSDWVIMGPEKGFAYILADQGYDVWMGYVRGSRYSKQHISYPPFSRHFWRFSLHEIGIYDVPAMIDYILQVTGREEIYYIGYSQGNTIFWIMASELPQYNDKIILMQAFAPVAFLSYRNSPLIRGFLKFFGSSTLEATFKAFGISEVLSNNHFLRKSGQMMCAMNNSLTQALCSNVLYLIIGINSKQVNSSIIPIYLGHYPSGGSSQQLIHFTQFVRSDNFQQYDYGEAENWNRYQSETPPLYNLTNVQSFVILHYTPDDQLVDIEDIQKLEKLLPNRLDTNTITREDFSHADFIWANDAQTLVYFRAMENMNNNIMNKMKNEKMQTNEENENSNEEKISLFDKIIEFFSNIFHQKQNVSTI